MKKNKNNQVYSSRTKPLVRNSLVHRTNTSCVGCAFFFYSHQERQAQAHNFKPPTHMWAVKPRAPVPGAPGRHAARMWLSIPVRTGFGSDLDSSQGLFKPNFLAWEPILKKHINIFEGAWGFSLEKRKTLCLLWDGVHALWIEVGWIVFFVEFSTKMDSMLRTGLIYFLFYHLILINFSCNW